MNAAFSLFVDATGTYYYNEVVVVDAEGRVGAHHPLRVEDPFTLWLGGVAFFSCNQPEQPVPGDTLSHYLQNLAVVDSQQSFQKTCEAPRVWHLTGVDISSGLFTSEIRKTEL